MKDIIKAVTKQIRQLDDMAGRQAERMRVAREKREAERSPVDQAEDKIDRIVNIISSVIEEGSYLDDKSQIMKQAFRGALIRGVRKSMNEFYTSRSAPRSDTAFTADRIELNSARDRIRDLELMVASCEQIITAATERETELTKANDGQAMVIAKLQAENAKLDDTISAIKIMIGDDPEEQAFEREYADRQLREGE